MVTTAQVRKLALELPDTEEKSHFGHPDFRVRGKIFAGLAPDGRRGTLKMSPERQAIVLAADPETFEAAAGAWGRHGWTYFVIAKVKAAQLRALLGEAWELTAPKRASAKKAAPKKAAKPRKSARTET